jgi:anti-sigma regulatory factor (Ser/Thr protein kinase)
MPAILSKVNIEKPLFDVTQSSGLNNTELALDGSLQELARLAEELERFCQESALGSDVQNDLNLALEELFTNALRHGGCEGMRQAVKIRLEKSGDGVSVEFCDRGKPFDPAAAPAPDPSRIGGLGIHLIRKVMRDVAYRRAGEWNRITMRRPYA